MKTIPFLLLLLGLPVLVIQQGCSEDELESGKKQEQAIIDKYLVQLGDTVYDVKESGLVYIELLKGTGIQPENRDTVTIRYRGYFTDGTTFDSNMDESETSSIEFVLGSDPVLPGIAEGVKYMKEGGISRFLTPSYMAYGYYGLPGYIPRFTPLLWHVQLLSVKTPDGK